MATSSPSDAEVTRRDNTIQIEVPGEYAAEERIDKFLTRFFPEASRTKVQRSINEGQALVNGADIKKSYAVQPGDTIVCRLVQPPPLEAQPEAIPLNIVYEDEDLIVVNKEAGMVVHPAPGHHSGTLVNALLHHVQGEPIHYAPQDNPDALDDDAIGLSMVNALPDRPDRRVVRPGIVHRLDKGTSGVLVVAKHDRAHRKLAEQFKAHTIHREYWAILWGHPEPPSGRIEGAIGRDRHDRKRMAVVPEERGKYAVTHYATIERHAHTALVRFGLETGRTHQIRVHAQHINHPVLGDPKYGGQTVRYGSQGSKRRRFFERLFETLPHPALHARALGFTHPRTGERVDFTAELPDALQHVLDRLRAVEGR